MNDKLGQCNICKKEYTSAHLEVQPGVTVYACLSCQEKAKKDFIFLCMNCGKAHSRSKKLIINKYLEHARIAEAAGMFKYAVYYKEQANIYMQCENDSIMMGINMCIECDPSGIVDHMK